MRSWTRGYGEQHQLAVRTEFKPVTYGFQIRRSNHSARLPPFFSHFRQVKTLSVFIRRCLFLPTSSPFPYLSDTYYCQVYTLIYIILFWRFCDLSFTGLIGVHDEYFSLNFPSRIIKESYEGMACQVVHGGQLTHRFNVKTGVRQGCLLSLFLFLLAIDWVMRQTTDGQRDGIQ